MKEQLCKLQTSEEVLELLKKYNYHESNEVFEVELMDLLKEFVDDEELLKVSGGKLNKQSFSNIVTSLAVAGSLCMPVQGVTGVQQKEKQEDKKSSYSIRLPKKEEVGLGVAVASGIIGLLAVGGVICKSTFTHRLLKDEKYTEMHEHFMKLATIPGTCKTIDFKKYEIDELKKYILTEWILWFDVMDGYYSIWPEGIGDKAYTVGDPESRTYRRAWNSGLKLQVPALLAADSLTMKLYKHADESKLSKYLNAMAKTPLKTEKLDEESDLCYKWDNGLVPASTKTERPEEGEMYSTFTPDCVVTSIQTMILLLCSKGGTTHLLGQHEFDKNWIDRVDNWMRKKTRFATSSEYESTMSRIRTPADQMWEDLQNMVADTIENGGNKTGIIRLD